MGGDLFVGCGFESHRGGARLSPWKSAFPGTFCLPLTFDPGRGLMGGASFRRFIARVGIQHSDIMKITDTRLKP